MGCQRNVSQHCWYRLFISCYDNDGIIAQILFGFSVILFWGDLKQSTGFDSGHWFWGTMLYLAVLLTVLGKAALVSEYVFFSTSNSRALLNLCRCSLWTKYTVAGENTQF